MKKTTEQLKEEIAELKEEIEYRSLKSEAFRLRHREDIKGLQDVKAGLKFSWQNVKDWSNGFIDNNLTINNCKGGQTNMDEYIDLSDDLCCDDLTGIHKALDEEMRGFEEALSW